MEKETLRANPLPEGSGFKNFIPFLSASSIQTVDIES